MKIIEQTDNKLVLVEKGYTEIVVFIFVVFFAIGLFRADVQHTTEGGIFLSVIALLVFSSISFKKIIFNKLEHTMNTSIWRLFKTTQESQDISSVQSVSFTKKEIEAEDHEGFRKTKAWYQFTLVRTDGSNIVLREMGNTSNSFSVNGRPEGIKSTALIGATIAEFLNIPFEQKYVE